jgi:membrane associated rhomboid family serine protease
MQQRHEPIFNVPGAVVAVLVVMIGLHALRQLLPEPADQQLVLSLAFIPARYSGYAAQLPGGDLAAVTSFVTHMAVHGDVTHLLFNSAWVLAFGGAIALRTGGARFLVFALFTGLAGASTFLVLNPGLLAPVVGASGAVAGLMGGTLRFMFRGLDLGGVRMLREAPGEVPLVALRDTIADRRVQLSTALWLLLNALAVIGIGTGEGRGAIAWEAHIGGFLAGLLTYGWFDRPVVATAPVAPPTIH